MKTFDDAIPQRTFDNVPILQLHQHRAPCRSARCGHGGCGTALKDQGGPSGRGGGVRGPAGSYFSARLVKEHKQSPVHVNCVRAQVGETQNDKRSLLCAR